MTCSTATNDLVLLPINPVANDGTPVDELVRQGLELVPVIKSAGPKESWVPLGTSGYDDVLAAIAAEMSALTDGDYDLGIQVSCRGDIFVSDVVKGLIDHKPPTVQTTLPADGGSISSPEDIHVVFDEPLACKYTLATFQVAGQNATELSFSCDGSIVQFVPTSSQVHSPLL